MRAGGAGYRQLALIFAIMSPYWNSQIGAFIDQTYLMVQIAQAAAREQ